MKHFFVISAIIIAIFTSCSTIENDYSNENTAQNKITTDVAYTHLNNNITKLNEQNFQTHSRGFFSRFLMRVLKVVAADCVGAVKGVVTGNNVWQSAVGASYNSAKKQSFLTLVDATNTLFVNAPVRRSAKADSTSVYNVYPKDFALDNVVLNNVSTTATIADSIGYYHNYIIYKVLEREKEIEFWNAVSDEACVLMLNEEINNSIPQSVYCDTVVTKETMDFVTFVSDESSKCNHYKELLNTVIAKEPQLENILNTLSLYLEGMELVTNDEDWESYCRQVIELISASDLSDTDKESLSAGITVGYASSKLWKAE